MENHKKVDLLPSRFRLPTDLPENLYDLINKSGTVEVKSLYEQSMYYVVNTKFRIKRDGEKTIVNARANFLPAEEDYSIHNLIPIRMGTYLVDQMTETIAYASELFRRVPVIPVVDLSTDRIKNRSWNALMDEAVAFIARLEAEYVGLENTFIITAFVYPNKKSITYNENYKGKYFLSNCALTIDEQDVPVFRID